MSFFQSLSGLYGASNSLDVIGNNISNAGTVGFKGSGAQFADMFSLTLARSGSGAVGQGSYVPAVKQQFGQGNITTTGNVMDVAIVGNGMFQMSDALSAGNLSYTRNGQLQIKVESDGVTEQSYLAGSNGLYVTGWPMGTSTASAAVPLELVGAVSAKPTTLSQLVVNLNAGTAVPLVAAFDPSVPASFSTSMSQTVFDSEGGAHMLQIYYARSGGAPNTWDAYTRLDGVAPAEEAAAGRQLTFGTDGIITGTTSFTSSFTLPVGGTATMSPITIDFAPVVDVDTGGIARSTQYGGGQTTLNQSLQDGYAKGELRGFSILADGTVEGQYSNGQTSGLGRIAMATFTNENGLRPLGDNQWAATTDSGEAVVAPPGRNALGLDENGNKSNRGVLQGGAIEESNVDITSELVNMILQQRNYQSNAQAIKVQDSMLQTLVSIKS